MIKDLTKGNIWKVLFSFAIPMLLSMVFQQIYSIVDSIIAGSFINENALAAVGASAPVTNIFIAIATGLSMGCSVIISQIYGSKHFARLKSAISTSIITVIFAAVAFTIIGVFTVNPIMTALKTPENIFADSALYLKIYAWGIVFLFIYNAANAVFTGLGDSRTPLYFLIFSSILNIVLDILFVTTFHMGVAGVAWATFIAQGIAGIGSMSYLIVKVKRIKVTEKYKKFNLQLLKRIAVIGIPSIMQQSFISVGQLFVQSLINSFGSNVVAGYTAGFKLNIFCICCVSTFGNALSSFCAQNIGAGENKRVIKGYRSTLIMGIGISSIFMLAFLIFGRQLIELFVGGSSGNQEVIEIGVQFLHIVASFYVLIAIKLITDGILRGTGRMGGFMVGTFLDLILRVAFSFILAPKFGYVGIWFSWPIGWIGGTSTVLISYFITRKKLLSSKKKQLSQSLEEKDITA